MPSIALQIQRTHVQLTVDTLPLKEGNRKELSKLHDNIVLNNTFVPSRLWDVTYPDNFLHP